MGRLMLLLLMAGFASAEVLEVPAQYGTIQTALDSLSAGDTVLVDSGLYGEALLAPCLAFTLLGNVPNDTTTAGRPIIDPRFSTRPQEPALALCAMTPTVIRNVEFRNGRTAWGFGGIRMLGSGGLLVSNCRFDSTGVGIALHDTLTVVELSYCDFRSCQGPCVAVVEPWTPSAGRLHARHCRFSGNTNAEGIVLISDSSIVDTCTFADAGNISMLHAMGKGTKVRGCTFGPTSRRVLRCMEVNYAYGHPSSVEISGNLFYMTRSATTDIIYIEGDCLPDTVAFVSGNTFQRAEGVGALVQQAINIQLGYNCPNLPVIVVAEDNLLQASGTGITHRAIHDFAGGAYIHGNVFRGYSNGAEAVVTVGSNAVADEVMHENYFMNCAKALDYWPTTRTMDARFNYWGDSTGPLVPGNPGGNGAWIIGQGQANVTYEPWLTDSLRPEAVEPSRAVVESQLLLEVYPNPFNAQARVKLTVRVAGVYRVELFNLLGQKVAMVFEGAVVREVTLPLNAAGLASGIYWLRAEDRLTKAVGMAKVLVLK